MSAVYRGITLRERTYDFTYLLSKIVDEIHLLNNLTCILFPFLFFIFFIFYILDTVFSYAVSIRFVNNI